MIINNIRVTKQDLEDLLKSIKSMQTSIDKGNLEAVKWSLDVLEGHLEHNLLQDSKKLKEVI